MPAAAWAAWEAPPWRRGMGGPMARGAAIGGGMGGGMAARPRHGRCGGVHGRRHGRRRLGVAPRHGRRHGGGGRAAAHGPDGVAAAAQAAGPAAVGRARWRVCRAGCLAKWPRPSTWRAKPKSNPFIRYGLLALFIVVMFLPYHYEPGGPVTIMPMQQQEVHAEITGVAERDPVQRRRAGQGRVR